ncbi:MAG TPA: 50S ribosomal protein L11 methyltransferase [Acidimicrobiales bacterium]
MPTADTPPPVTGAITGPGMSLTVHVAVTGRDAEVAADALWRAGAAAIEERPGLLVAAAPAGDAPVAGGGVGAVGAVDGVAGRAGATGAAGDPAPLLAAVAGRWPAEVVAVDAGAALDAWRRHARTVVVGRLVVRPPWVAPPGDAEPGGPSADGSPPRRAAPVEVVVDPGRAFGHGAHPSTRLLLAALDGLVTEGERVLDVGCGSGVLALAALALGAGRAVAVDIDPAALAATRDNAARNGVADRLAVLGPAGGLARVTGRFDLVLANMLLPDLVAVAPEVARRLAPAGVVAVGGVLAGQGRDLVAAYRAVGLVPVPGGDRVDEGWLAITLRAV